MSTDIEGLRYTWSEFVQTSGYPPRGEPGAIREFLPHVERGFFVRIYAYLDYDERGFLRGALMFFPDGSPIDPVGTVSVIVRPNARRGGVATRLMAVALERHPEIDPEVQEYTPDGRAFRASLPGAREPGAGGTIGQHD